MTIHQNRLTEHIKNHMQLQGIIGASVYGNIQFDLFIGSNKILRNQKKIFQRSA